MKTPKHVQGFFLYLKPGRYVLLLPSRAYITSVGLSGTGLPMLYAEVDRSAPKVERIFYTLQNGDEVPELAYHVGTLMTGRQVYHIYAEPEPPQSSSFPLHFGEKAKLEMAHCATAATAT